MTRDDEMRARLTWFHISRDDLHRLMFRGSVVLVDWNTEQVARNGARSYAEMESLVGGSVRTFEFKIDGRFVDYAGRHYRTVVCEGVTISMIRDR